MNFLAHTYLSFGNDDAIVGNLVADMIKGKQIDSLPEDIQKGIVLHRQIDTFTDQHEVNKSAKNIFTKSVGRYNASFLDVAYDHYLATDVQRIPNNGWQNFADKCYSAIESRHQLLPQDFLNMFVYMKNENWLANYQNNWLIERSFERLARRAKYLDESVNVFNDFETNYTLIADSYGTFFPELEEFAKNTYIELYGYL